MIIDNYNVIINGKNFYDQPIDSDIKRYEKLGTTGCWLNYDNIENHNRFIAVNLVKKKLDADSKAIQ